MSLTETFRAASGRIIAALAARFRDLDLAEEAFSEACLRAARVWPRDGAPRDGAAWLYRTAQRVALDALRRRRTAERLLADVALNEPAPADVRNDEYDVIPDERLRLIFVCCHPAVAANTRAALTLRLVCGLSTTEIARSFLMSEATLAQRIVRAKRKIVDAGVSFEIPGPDAWLDRLDAVLSTLEVAYAHAHEDASGVGAHAGYASEMLSLTKALADLLPKEPEPLALAATVRYAEARRTARLAEDGAMIPLDQQDPALWCQPLIREAEVFLRRAAALTPSGPRALEAAIHSAWCGRGSLDEPPPWPTVLAIYDALLGLRDDPVVRLNRAVALAEVVGPEAALDDVERLDPALLVEFPAYHAVRADLLARTGRVEAARAAYQAVLALKPSPAERKWLERKLAQT